MSNNIFIGLKRQLAFRIISFYKKVQKNINTRMCYMFTHISDVQL